MIGTPHSNMHSQVDVASRSTTSLDDIKQGIALSGGRLICEECHGTVGYKGRMLCPSHALDAIHADGLTLDQAMGCAYE